MPAPNPVFSKICAAVLIFSGVGAAASSSAWAHGEDRPGPHGGVIRMPGAFHTELVRGNGSGFRVYLLDFQFAKPVTENSSVEGVVDRGGSRKPLECRPRKNFFECRLEGGTPLQKGDQILLRTRRQGEAGGEVSYPVSAPRG